MGLVVSLEQLVYGGARASVRRRHGLLSSSQADYGTLNAAYARSASASESSSLFDDEEEDKLGVLSVMTSKELVRLDYCIIANLCEKHMRTEWKWVGGISMSADRRLVCVGVHSWILPDVFVTMVTFTVEHGEISKSYNWTHAAYLHFETQQDFKFSVPPPPATVTTNPLIVSETYQPIELVKRHTREIDLYIKHNNLQQMVAKIVELYPTQKK